MSKQALRKGDLDLTLNLVFFLLLCHAFGPIPRGRGRCGPPKKGKSVGGRWTRTRLLVAQTRLLLFTLEEISRL